MTGTYRYCRLFFCIRELQCSLGAPLLDAGTRRVLAQCASASCPTPHMWRYSHAARRVLFHPTFVPQVFLAPITQGLTPSLTDNALIAQGIVLVLASSINGTSLGMGHSLGCFSIWDTMHCTLYFGLHSLDKVSTSLMHYNFFLCSLLDFFAH